MKCFLCALVLSSAFLVLAGCGGETPTQLPPTPLAPTDTPRATSVDKTGAYLKDVVLAQAVQGNSYTPLDTPDTYNSPLATFYAVALLDNPPKNVRLRAEWYLVNAPGFMPNSLIEKAESVVPDSNIKQVNFTLEPKNGKWPPGGYRINIYADDTLAATRIFRVVDNAPDTAGPDVIKQVVLAQDVKPSTFEPLNPTTEFAKTAPAIYVAVQIENSPPGTIYRVRWYPPGMEPLEKELAPGPSLWLESHLLPADSGFPTGEYKVEVYVNNQLADTKTFKVK